MTTKNKKPELKYLGKKHSLPKGNFTQIPNEVLYGLGKYSILKSEDVRIYGILLGQVSFRLKYNQQVDENEAAYCYMTQQQLGDKANVGSRKTVSASVERLESVGLVYACDNGTKKSKTYFVAVPDEVKNDEKAFVDVDEIGKKLTDEQKQKRKAKRESKRVSKATEKEIADFLEQKESDDMPDFEFELKSEKIDFPPLKLETVKIKKSWR